MRWLAAGGTARRAGAFLALFALFITIFYTGAPSSAASPAEAAGASLPSVARQPHSTGASALSAAMFQFPVDDLTTYAADCVTPKSDFNLGEVACVRANFPPSFFSFRGITWVDPGNHILDAAFITSNGQTDLFTIPSSATSVVGDQIVDNRGTWRVDMRSADGSRTAVASFVVHEPANPRADLQISAGSGGRTVESGATVPVKVVVYNAGPDAATDVQVKALSVPGLSLDSLVGGAGAVCGTGGTCTLASLERGENAVFIATYSVTAAAGTFLSSTATVESDTEDPHPRSNSDGFTFFVLQDTGENQSCTLTPPEPIIVNGSTIPPNPNNPSQPSYGAVVNYQVSAEGDACTPVQCDKPSGSIFPAGTTTVTCTAASSDFTIFPVTVVDTRSLVITLIGANPLKVECDASQPFTDPGATTNNPGITPIATISNPNAAGSFTVTYTATDNNGTPDNLSDDIVAQAVTRTVNVIDKAPLIDMGDDSTVIVECRTPYVDAGATATDACSGGNVPVTTSGSVDVNTPGTYTITYTATDGTNTSTKTRTVIVAPATITLNGESTMTVECHTPYVDAGATATHACSGGNVPVTTSGSVDVNTPGTYTITYTVTDGTSTSTATRTVNVVDTTAPVITLGGASTMTVECHTGFTDPGAAANDACDGPVGVTVTGTVNPNTVGTYTLTYTATDDQGTPIDTSDDLVATKTRTVNVVDTAGPVITLNGNSTVTVECHTSYTETGATAFDACGNAFVPVTTSGSVDVNTPGTYTITYTATDGTNTSTKTRTVNVVDRIAPVISCPANIVVNLPANSTAISMPVNFNVTATDSCSTAVNVVTSHASGASFPVGTTTVNATATDPSGNTSSCSFTVTVHYLFTGFFSPISNLPVVNTVKAGSAIPIKFSLSGNKGLSIFADSPASGVIGCNSNDPAVDLSEIDTPGESGLTYSASSDQYQYNWKTLKAWEGTCRQLVVILNDGTEHRANFKFK